MSTGLELRCREVDWQLSAPFVIAGYRYETMPALVLELCDKAGRVGRSEVIGIDYLGETVASMRKQIEALDPAALLPVDPPLLQHLLPAGGARNALDCALWDLHVQQTGTRIDALLGVDVPGPFPLLGTLSLDSPERMAAAAASHGDWRVLKLKLGGGDGLDGERVQAVRAARSDAAIVVDVNCAWDLAELERVMPMLEAAEVGLVEQPLPPEADDVLEGRSYPVPLGADESFQYAGDLARCVARYDFVNVKLDKCGGLTEGLHIVARARELGLGLMVGNMCGSSLAMAPAMFVAAYCAFVDLDGPLLQDEDVDAPLDYRGGAVAFAERWCWGAPRG